MSVIVTHEPKEKHTEFYLSFVENLERLRSFYYVSKPVFDSLQQRQKEWMDLQEKFGLDRIAREEKDGRMLIRILPDELIKIIKEARENHLEDLAEFESFLLSQILIFSTSLFDFYIQDLIRNVCLRHRDILRSKNKELDYDTLLSFSSLDELIEYIIDRECEHVGYLSYKEKCDYLEKKLSFDLTDVKDLGDDMIEIFEIRNILVHNRGIVNEKFLGIVKKPGYTLGQKVAVDRDLMTKAVNTIHNVVTKIDSIAKNKFFKD